MRGAKPRNFIGRLVLGLLFFCAGGRAVESELTSRDVLVYRDGDRVQGRLVEQADNILVFQSDRFGLLRVPQEAAVVIKGEKTSVSATAGAPPLVPVTTDQPGKREEQKAAQREADRAAHGDWFYPAVLASRLREFFGPWHGRIAFSTDVVTDTSDRTTLALEGRLTRKWADNEIQLNGRYDYSETNALTTTDLLKADALWRHNFSKRSNSFVQYRPTLEWNRASRKAGVPADYVLLQQEIGFGMNLLSRPDRKLRVGVSENLFDAWTTSPPTSHNSRTVESAFIETEWRLPWGLLLSDRGVYYYSFASQNDGWENRIELTKKFTETLSAAIRHETRQGSPDGTALDYTRLRLLLGLDF
jgi:hypothetical protein